MNNLYTQANWSDVITSLTNGVEVTVDFNYWNLNTPGYLEIYKMWQDAKFNPASIKWTNYYPNKHFSQELVDDVAKHLQLAGVHRSWISQVDPGFFAPWHWDIDDSEAEYLKQGVIKRYSIMITGPAMGHIFILGNDYYYNSPQGLIVEWKNYKEWHSGINAGLTPKYMFHMIGY